MKKVTFLFCLICLSISIFSCKKDYSLEQKITILSPTQNESFEVGGQITVKWLAPVPPDMKVLVYMKIKDQDNKTVEVALRPVNNSLSTNMGEATENDGEEVYYIPWLKTLKGKNLFGTGEDIGTNSFVVQVYLGKVLRNNKWIPALEYHSAESKNFVVSKSKFSDGCYSEDGYSSTTGEPCKSTP